MSVKHTPGPWKRVLDHNGGIIVDSNCRFIGEFRNPRDADLAAIAPELLDVCKYAYALLHQDTNSQFDALVDNLRKVIKNATE